MTGGRSRSIELKDICKRGNRVLNLLLEGRWHLGQLLAVLSYVFGCSHTGSQTGFRKESALIHLLLIPRLQFLSLWPEQSSWRKPNWGSFEAAHTHPWDKHVSLRQLRLVSRPKAEASLVFKENGRQGTHEWHKWGTPHPSPAPYKEQVLCSGISATDFNASFLFPLLLPQSHDTGTPIWWPSVWQLPNHTSGSEEGGDEKGPRAGLWFCGRKWKTCGCPLSYTR